MEKTRKKTHDRISADPEMRMEEQTTLAKRSSPLSIVAIALITAACLTGDSMLYMALPTHWQSAGLDSLWEVGILLSVNRFIRLPLTPLVGWLYSRIGLRTGVLAAVLMTGLLTVGYGLVHSFAGWLLLRCLWGVAWTFLRMGAYLMILDCTDDLCRGVVFGKYNGLFRLGSLVGMMGGGLIADRWGLAAAAFAFGGIVTVTLPLTLWYVPTARVTPKEMEPFLKRLQQLNDPLIYRVLITGMVIAFAFQGVVASSLSHMIRVSWGNGVAFGFGLIGAATLAGTLQAMRWSWEPWLAPWFGRVSDGRQRRGKLLAVILLIAATFFVLIPIKIPFVTWLGVIVGMQITATALTTIGDAAAADAAVNQSRATVMTLYVMATDIGAALGPFVGYLMADLWGAGSMYWGAAVLLATVSIWWGRFPGQWKAPSVA